MVFLQKRQYQGFDAKTSIFASKIKSSATFMHTLYVYETFKQNICLIFCGLISSFVNSTCTDC